MKNSFLIALGIMAATTFTGCEPNAPAPTATPTAPMTPATTPSQATTPPAVAPGVPGATGVPDSAAPGLPAASPSAVTASAAASKLAASLAPLPSADARKAELTLTADEFKAKMNDFAMLQALQGKVIELVGVINKVEKFPDGTVVYLADQSSKTMGLPGLDSVLRDSAGADAFSVGQAIKLVGVFKGDSLKDCMITAAAPAAAETP